MKQNWAASARKGAFFGCHKDFNITQAQTKVSFFYLKPLLQVEFRAIFDPFLYILLNGSNRNAILSRM